MCNVFRPQRLLTAVGELPHRSLKEWLNVTDFQSRFQTLLHLSFYQNYSAGELHDSIFFPIAICALWY
jgi:hypothetical protein